MTAIINKKSPIDTKNFEHHDKIVRKLEGRLDAGTPRHSYNPTHPTHPTQISDKQTLDFILRHFEGLDFPRRISTRTTQGRQVLVNDKPEALARFKQANQLDCRISAYNELDDTPNFLFIDIDSLDFSAVEKTLNKCKEFAYYPTVLHSGSGYHIYQPVSSVRLSDISDFGGYQHNDLSKQFLRFAAEYLADNNADANHNPSLKSCMVRVPGSINSKNGQEVRVIQEWNGDRPSIVLLLGIFYSWLATRKIIGEKTHCRIPKFCGNNSSGKINWIEVLLRSPLDDYRKTIVNLVLAPYLINIRQVDYETASTIIKHWLELCAVETKLNFNAQYLTNAALVNAEKTSYKPMRLDTLKARNFAIYEKLGLK